MSFECSCGTLVPRTEPSTEEANHTNCCAQEETILCYALWKLLEIPKYFQYYTCSSVGLSQLHRGGSPQMNGTLHNRQRWLGGWSKGNGEIGTCTGQGDIRFPCRSKPPQICINLFAELRVKKSDFPLLKLSFILGNIYMSQLQTLRTDHIYGLKYNLNIRPHRNFTHRNSPWQYFNKGPSIRIADCRAQVFLSYKLVWYSLFKKMIY